MVTFFPGRCSHQIIGATRVAEDVPRRPRKPSCQHQHDQQRDQCRDRVDSFRRPFCRSFTVPQSPAKTLPRRRCVFQHNQDVTGLWGNEPPPAFRRRPRCEWCSLGNVTRGSRRISAVATRRIDERPQAAFALAGTRQPPGNARQLQSSCWGSSSDGGRSATCRALRCQRIRVGSSQDSRP